MSDEIYGPLHHKNEHFSISRYYPEGTIIRYGARYCDAVFKNMLCKNVIFLLSNGISKWLGSGGWRLGYQIYPPNLAWLCEALTSVASETFTSVSAPIQHAAIAGKPRAAHSSSSLSLLLLLLLLL